jgi:EmrB/QacA subfamily drug resistance transporter
MEKRWQILFITSLGVFIASLDLFIVNIGFPAIADDFSSASLGDLSWILNAYAIVFAALLVPAGRLADRIGRKRMFLLGLATFTTGSALCALAPSVGALVAARVLQAVGAAMIMPSTLGLILPAFPADKRAVAVGIWSAIGGVAAALGPPIGGLLVQVDWRWIFIVNVPIGIGALIAGRALLPEVREAGHQPRPDVISALVFAASIALLTAGIVEGPDWGWSDPRVIGAFVGAVLGVAAFVRRSAHHPAPVVELSLLRIRPVAVGNAAAMVFFAGFAAMLLGAVIFLTEVWGYSIVRAGLAIAPGPLVAAITAIPAGRIAARYGPRLPAVAGGLAFAAGFAWTLSFVGTEPAYASQWLPGFMLGGLGVGLTLPSLPTAATAPLPPSRFATGTAVFAMSRQIGSAIGVAIFVAIIGESTGRALYDAMRDAWWFTFAMGLGAAGLATALPGSAAELLAASITPATCSASPPLSRGRVLLRDGRS